MSTDLRLVAMEFDRWVRRKLPAYNDSLDRASQARNHAPEFELMLGEGSAFSTSLFTHREALRSIPEYLAWDIFSDLGFFLGSCARHGVLPGDPRVEETVKLCKVLGKRFSHPPRDSLYTYIALNSRDKRGRYRSFTNAADEQAFIDLTKQSLVYSERAAAALSSFQESDCRELHLLDQASLEIEAYQVCFTALEQREGEGPGAMKAAFFFNLFRDYFPTITVDGIAWGPPTAANAVPVILVDYLLGLDDATYRQHTERRFVYFTPKDRLRLRRAMGAPGILDDIIGQSATAEELAEALQLHDREAVARELYELGRRVGFASSAHWGLIQKFLIKPAEELQKQLQASGHGASDSVNTVQQQHVVNPYQGASGMAFPDVWRIREMRMKNPKLDRLKSAIERLDRVFDTSTPPA